MVFQYHQLRKYFSVKLFSNVGQKKRSERGRRTAVDFHKAVKVCTVISQGSLLDNGVKDLVLWLLFLPPSKFSVSSPLQNEDAGRFAEYITRGHINIGGKNPSNWGKL